MACRRRTKAKSGRHSPHRDESGIALFMVIGAIAVLTVLVTEFTYIAQVGQIIAFGGLDQTKAHYLAKSGLKLSLLRLKAYKQLKDHPALKPLNLPKGILEMVWRFPFSYPLSSGSSSATVLEKDGIEKFNKDLGMDGAFTTRIESESAKYNLNMLLEAYAPIMPSISPSPGQPPPPPPKFDPEKVRSSLSEYLGQILKNKTEADPDFAAEYRDTQIHELVDNIAGWVDRNYERRNSTSREKYPMKKAPFYSVSELHMVPGLDDELYELFSPSVTARVTSEINVNTMREATLTALIPDLSKEDIQEFFKYRDSLESDGQFKKPNDFYAYLEKNVPAYRNNSEAITQLKNSFRERNILLTTEETEFKIEVRAQVNQSIKVVEAWVSTAEPPTGGPPKDPPPPPDPGIRITYMKIH